MLNLVHRTLAALGVHISPWMEDLRLSEVIMDLYARNARAQGSGINIHFFGRHYSVYLVEWKNMFVENRRGQWN